MNRRAAGLSVPLTLRTVQGLSPSRFFNPGAISRLHNSVRLGASYLVHLTSTPASHFGHHDLTSSRSFAQSRLIGRSTFRAYTSKADACDGNLGEATKKCPQHTEGHSTTSGAPGTITMTVKDFEARVDEKASRIRQEEVNLFFMEPERALLEFAYRKAAEQKKFERLFKEMQGSPYDIMEEAGKAPKAKIIECKEERDAIHALILTRLAESVLAGTTQEDLESLQKDAKRLLAGDEEKDRKTARGVDGLLWRKI
ncbi:MAG: hypothetical protein Q9169_007523 [Polycauliona sp. 2 TL-2023]